MEVLYLWIEKYKNIEKQGFNFSSQYRFDYKPETKALIRLLDNPNHIPDFFPEGISNVTAIIGENGSGKSTLLRFIKDSQKGYFYQEGYRKFIIIFSNKIIYHHRELVLNISSEISNEFTTKSFVNKNDIYDENTLIPIIFYSNTIDTDSGRLDMNHLDISSIQLLKNGNDSYNIHYQTKYLEQLEAYKRQGIRLQIEFLNKIRMLEANYYPNFTLPSHLLISFNTKNFDFVLNSETNKETNKEKYKGIKILTEGVWIKQFNSNAEFMTNIYWSFALGLIIAVTTYLNTSEDIDKEIKKINEIFYDEPDEKMINKFIDYIDEELSEGRGIPIYTKNVKGSLDFFKSINESISNNKITFFKNFYLKIPINNDIGFIDNFLYTGFSSPIFNFDWSNGNEEVYLSSGEEAMFNFQARFYSVIYKEYTEWIDSKPKTEQYISDKKNLLILIDEGDIEFHPQWQKQYLEVLFKLFKVIFLKDVNLKNFTSIAKNIQIILTSHSPFITSDLPKDNVIFLEKHKQTGLCEVSKLKDHSQTFGQNIHTLFADSFFMDSLMGEFAKDKILTLVNDLTSQELSNDYSENDKKRIKSIIGIVGETLIQTKLANLYQTKFGESPFESLEEKKERLQKELEQVNRQLNS